MQRIIQIKPKKGKCTRKLPTRAFSFQRSHRVLKKCNLGEQLLKGGKKRKIIIEIPWNAPIRMQFYEEAFSFYRPTPFQAAWGPPFIVCLNLYAMICSFSLSAILHRVPPVRRITSRPTMEIGLCAFIVQYNPQPFVSLCVFYVLPINLPIYWKDNYLFLPSNCLRLRQMCLAMRTYTSTRGRSNSAVSLDQQRLC